MKMRLFYFWAKLNLGNNDFSQTQLWEFVSKRMGWYNPKGKIVGEGKKILEMGCPPTN